MRGNLRHIRVASKQELKDRIITTIDDINRDPSSTLGPTRSMKRLDMSRSSEAVY